MDVTETMGSTSESTMSSTNLTTNSVAAGVTVVLLLGLLATLVALLFIVYYKRKRSALVNLTKPHKGSEENSYASSEHSHQQGSKYSESPEPGYDAIKPTSHMKHTKDKIFSQKSSHLDMSLNPKHPSEYASIENLDYSEISNSHKTTGSHIICSCEYSAQSTKDNPSTNSHKYDETKEDVYVADSEIEKNKDIQKQLTEDAAKCNNNSTKGEASPIPPQTIEMMYTAVQKRPKDSILAEVEDDAPPVPPYMEKEDKETEATAKGSDEGSPPPVPPQTAEMQLYDIKIAQI